MTVIANLNKRVFQSGQVYSNDFVPKQINSNIFWGEAKLSILYGGGFGGMTAVSSSGTTPPVITLSGTPTTSVSGLKITCTLGGVLTTWTGTWSIDNGTTSTAFTSASTVSIGGSLTLNIAAGTANTNNIWTSSPTVSTLADLSSKGNNATQATAAKQPANNPSNSGTNNLRSLDFVGSSSQTLGLDGIATPLSGTSQPWTMFVVGFQPTAATTGYFCIGGATAYIITVCRKVTTTNYELQCRNNAGTTPDISSGTAPASLYIYEAMYDATNISLYANGTQEGSNTAFSGACTLTHAQLGSLNQTGTPALFFTGSIAEALIYNRALSTNERNRVRKYLGSKYNISVNSILWEVDFTTQSTGSLATLPAGLTLSRSGSNATVQTSATAITTGIAANTARIGNDGNGQGLVLEEARTNLVLQSSAWATTWTELIGTETVTNNAVASPDGTTNGTTLTSPTGGTLGIFQTITWTTGKPYSYSTWAMSQSGTVKYRKRVPLIVGTSNQLSSDITVNATWSKNTFISTITTGGSSSYTVQNDSSGDILSIFGYGAQIEQASFPTELIPTTTTTVTRNGEQLTTSQGSVMIYNGYFGFEFKIRPKGSSTSYSANMRLFSIDSNNYAEINNSTLILTVVVGGVSYSLGTALPSWSAGNTLEIYIAGGNSRKTIGSARVNGGAKTVLDSNGTALGSLSGSSIDLLCNGTNNQFTSWVQTIRAWAPNFAPSWA